MSEHQTDLFDSLMNFSVTDLNNLEGFVSLIWDDLPINNKEDIIVSLVFVDLARDPIGLITRYRSKNFRGYKIGNYNNLRNNFRYISDNAIIRVLMTDPNLIVVEDIDNISSGDPVDKLEKEFMQNTGWKSAVFHSMFVDEVIFGYVVVFSIERLMFQKEIDIITEFLGEHMPIINDKMLPAAFMWKSKIYKQEIQEIENNVNNLFIAITGDGLIIRVNSISKFYLNKAPQELLGQNLQEMAPELYFGIQQSANRDKSKDELIRVSIINSKNELSTLELLTWNSGLSSDDTIICFATDISWMMQFNRTS